MGQYYNGRKIGICETMMYMRLEEAKQLAQCGAKDDDGISFASMLTDNETMFRFPFPDEDNVKGNLLSIANHSPSFELSLPPEVELNHRTICVSNADRNGNKSMNIFLPCPHDKKNFNLKTSMNPPSQHISIMYHAMRYPLYKGVDGNTLEDTSKDMIRATLFECSRCGQLQRCDQEEMATIVEYNRELFTQQHMPRKTLQWDDPDFVKSEELKLSNKLQILNRMI